MTQHTSSNLTYLVNNQSTLAQLQEAGFKITGKAAPATAATGGAIAQFDKEFGFKITGTDGKSYDFLQLLGDALPDMPIRVVHGLLTGKLQEMNQAQSALKLPQALLEKPNEYFQGKAALKGMKDTGQFIDSIIKRYNELKPKGDTPATKETLAAFLMAKAEESQTLGIHLRNPFIHPETYKAIYEEVYNVRKDDKNFPKDIPPFFPSNLEPYQAPKLYQYEDQAEKSRAQSAQGRCQAAGACVTATGFNFIANMSIAQAHGFLALRGKVDGAEHLLGFSFYESELAQKMSGKFSARPQSRGGTNSHFPGTSSAQPQSDESLGTLPSPDFKETVATSTNRKAVLAR